MKTRILPKCLVVPLLGALFSLSIFAYVQKKPSWGSKLDQPVCEYDALRLTDAQIGTLGIYWYVTEVVSRQVVEIESRSFLSS